MENKSVVNANFLMIISVLLIHLKEAKYYQNFTAVGQCIHGEVEFNTKYIVGLIHVQNSKVLYAFKKKIWEYAKRMLQKTIKQSKSDFKVGKFKLRNSKILLNEKKEKQKQLRLSLSLGTLRRFT